MTFRFVFFAFSLLQLDEFLCLTSVVHVVALVVLAVLPVDLPVSQPGHKTRVTPRNITRLVHLLTRSYFFSRASALISSILVLSLTVYQSFTSIYNTAQSSLPLHICFLCVFFLLPSLLSARTHTLVCLKSRSAQKVC